MNITSPKPGVVIRPLEIIIINGTSSGLAKDTVVIVTLDGMTETSLIGHDGNWSVNIKAPITAGNYSIEVFVGNINESISIIIKDLDEIGDNGGEDIKDEDKNMGLLGTGVIIGIAILMGVIIIIIILLFLVMKKKRIREIEKDKEKSEKELEDKELEGKELEEE